MQCSVLKGGGLRLQQQAVAKGSQACCSVTPPPFNTAIAFPPLKQPEMTELHEIIHFTGIVECLKGWRCMGEVEVCGGRGVVGVEVCGKGGGVW